jgi:hypothetical protein
VLNGDKLLDILRTGGDLNDAFEIFECSQEQPRRGLRRKMKIVEDKMTYSELREEIHNILYKFLSHELNAHRNG